MSDLSAQNLTALGSTVLPTVLPPDVRKAGVKGEQLYQAALGFEQMLTEQLTNQLASTMQGTDGTDSSSSSEDPSSQSIFSTDSSSSSMVSQMLPQALSDGITQAGGLGIAHQLYLLLAQQTGLSPTGRTGTGSTASAASGGTAGGGQ